MHHREQVAPTLWGRQYDPRPSEESEVILFNGRFPFKSNKLGQSRERLISIHIDIVAGVGGWPNNMSTFGTENHVRVVNVYLCLLVDTSDDKEGVDRVAIERLRRRVLGEICLKFVFKYQVNACLEWEAVAMKFISFAIISSSMLAGS